MATTKITSIRRLEETTLRGGCGDNWHMTWAANGTTYMGLCDGLGWEDVPGYNGKNYNTRVFGLHGEPPDHSFEYLPGFPDLLSEPGMFCNRYYGFGIIAIDDCIYHYLSTPNTPFAEPGARFCGAKLIYSPDLGSTWLNQDGSPVGWEEWGTRSRDNMAFFKEDGEAFSLLTALQMGRNYEHNTDGYIYMYAPNGNVEGTMNQLVMFRVPKYHILDRDAYEFFVSRGGNGVAEWSHDIDDRGVVYEFQAGWVNTKVHPYSWHPSVVYNEPLGLYMMANWGMGCDDDGLWFGKPSYLGIWTASQPWGPWDQVHEETAWTPANDTGARAYQPQIAPQWIAPDGKSFQLVWTDFQVTDMTRPDHRPYYCFNTQRVEIETA
jgi:hypothetical protein